MDPQPLRFLNAFALGMIAFVLLAAIALLFAISRNRIFQVDEVEHLHAAYNIRDGRMIYRESWQAHPPLIYLFLTPLTDTTDPAGSYKRARVLFSLFLLTTVGVSALCAWELSSGWGALLAAGLALLHSTLVERGMEIRPDGLLALCIMLALLIDIRWRRSFLARHAAEAVVLSFGALLTQKAIFACVAFGFIWAWRAWRERRARLLWQPLLFSLIPIAIALSVMAMLGIARPFIDTFFSDALSAGMRGVARQTFSPVNFIVRESSYNLAFAAFVFMAFASLMKRRDPRFLMLAFLTAVLIASLWANPFPWPYVHVSVLPIAIVFVAVAAGQWLSVERVRPFAGPIVVVLLALVAWTSIPRLMDTLARTNGQQLATLREINRITAPHDRVFDLAGLYYRPDAYYIYSMSGDMLRSYAYGRFPRIIPQLQRNDTAAVILNYRNAVLGLPERRFLRSHFTHYWGNVFLPGADLTHTPIGEDRLFDVLGTRRFRYEGAGSIRIDGQPFREGELTRGLHTIRIEKAAPSRLISATPLPNPPSIPATPLFANFD